MTVVRKQGACRGLWWPAIVMLILLLMTCAVPASASINVWRILVEPGGEIIGNQTRVTVTAFMDIYSEDRVTFSPDNTLKMKTDLEDAVWSPVINYDGRLIELPVRQGRSIVLSSWDLSYPSGKKESLKVTVKGWAPGVGSDQDRTLFWLAEESPHGVVNHTEKSRVARVLLRPGAVREEEPVVPTGSLHVRSDPPGARILLDGVDRGQTPAILERIPAGNQSLTLSKAGYHDAVLSVSVIERQVVEVAATLVAGTGGESGVLVVESSPPGAAIFFDGKKAGLTPLTLSPVTQGDHLIRLELEGYAPHERSVQVPAGSFTHLSVHMVPAHPGGMGAGGAPDAGTAVRSGSVQVTSSPPGADVILDGEFRGLTPTRIQDLSPGQHTIRLTLPFFEESVMIFMLIPGEEHSVHHAFGIEELRLPGFDAIIGFFSGMKIGLPSPAHDGQPPAVSPVSNREKAYEELMKQIEGDEG